MTKCEDTKFPVKITSSRLSNRFLLHYFKYHSYDSWASNAVVALDEAVGHEKAAQYARDISVYLIHTKKYDNAINWLEESMYQYALSYDAFRRTKTDKTTESINTLAEGLHLSVIINHPLKTFFGTSLTDEVETNKALISRDSSDTTQYINQYRHIKASLVTNNNTKLSHLLSMFDAMERPFIPVGPPYTPASNILHGLVNSDNELFDKGLHSFIDHSSHTIDDYTTQNIRQYEPRLSPTSIVNFEATFYYALAVDTGMNYTTNTSVLIPQVVSKARTE